MWIVLNWLRSNWKLVIACVLLLCAFGFGYNSGSRSVQSAWDKQKAADQEAMLDALTTHAEMIRKLEVKKDENESKIDTLTAANRKLAGSVLLPPLDCGYAHTPSGSQQASPGTGELWIEAQRAFADFTAGLVAEAQRADQIVEQCRVMQGIILPHTPVQ